MKSIVVVLLFITVAFTSISAATTIPLFKSSPSKKALVTGTSGYKLVIDPHYVEKVLSMTSFSTSIPGEAFAPEDLWEGSDITLDLTLFSVIGPQTYVVIETIQGEVAGEFPTVRTYKGTVRNIPGTLATLAIEPNGTVSGFIRTANRTYTIGVQRGEQYTSYLTKTEDIPIMANFSGCEVLPESPNKVSRPKRSAPKNQPLAATQTMIIAIDVDKACNDNFGSSASEITNYLAARFAAISAVYESEVDVGIQLGRIKIYTVPDPFSANTTAMLLNKFSDYWVATHDTVTRSVAHLISMQEMQNPTGAPQGRAGLGVLCDKEYGYGVDVISGPDGYPALDEKVIAHELGHNVGSHHTHNCSQYTPAIDSCVAAEDGNCFSGSKQVTGTIMSYCNKTNLTFHPRTRDVLHEGVLAAPCLGTLAKIQVKLDSVIFPKVTVGGTKDTLLTALIKNTGTVPLTITSMQIDNLEIDSEFYLKSLPTFPLVLQPNATQNVTVVFHPLFGEDRYADLIITHNASGAISTIGLHGFGSEPYPIFEDLDFGFIEYAGNYDTTFTFVENFGDGPLTISKIALTGQNASEFSILSGGTPPNIIVNGEQTASIGIRFAPKSLGIKEATLEITHDASDDIYDIEIIAFVESLLAVKHGNTSATASLSVSPNPTSDKFTIDITSTETGVACQLVLVDQLGRVVANIASEKLTSDGVHKIWTIDPGVASGTYQLIAKIGGSVLSERVVILKQ